MKYDSLSRIKSAIDENGNETKYNYDANGNILETINPDGSINQFEYDSMDRLTKLSLNRKDELNLVNETQNTIYKYNKNGLITEEINSVGNSKFFTYDGNGNLINKTDEQGYVTNYEYNPLDLVKKINYNNEKTALFIYDKLGNLTELEDWNGKTSIENDLLGRVTEITDFNDRTVKHEFDGVSNRTSITYPDETLAKYEYDEENKITKVTDGEETTEYNYDTYENLEETIYPNGEKIINSYDEFNQLTKTEEFLNTEKRQTTEYNYDLIGNITLEENSGINNIKKQYNYDIRNRLSTVKENETETEYSYDTLSNLIKEVTGEKEINYNYNSLNQLVSKSDTENNYSYLYDKRGNLIQESKNDSVNRSFEYDSLNKLSKGISEEKDEIQYIYNGLGKRVQTIKNITNKHLENQNSENTNSRLDKAPENILFRMDNITEADTEVPTDLRTYISNLALVKQNETPEIVTDYVVDYLNLFSQPLVSYEKDSFETKYVYGYGKISKTTKDLENEFTRLNLENILIVAPNIKIATEGLEKTYFHKNIIGTTTYVTDRDGKLITNQTYDSFGKNEINPEDLINLSGLEERSNYTGHSYDEILESYFAQARIYEPDVKRFLAEDPIKDGLNWYGYTVDNPVNFVDPTGKSTSSPFKKLVKSISSPFKKLIKSISSPFKKQTTPKTWINTKPNLTKNIFKKSILIGKSSSNIVIGGGYKGINNILDPGTQYKQSQKLFYDESALNNSKPGKDSSDNDDSIYNLAKAVSDFENRPSVNSPLKDRHSKNPLVYDSISYLVEKAEEFELPKNLVLATAFQESEFLQFNKKGEAFTLTNDGGGGYGIMQIQLSVWSDVYDPEKIKSDWKYNIDAGIEILSSAYKKAKDKTGYSGDDLARSAYVLYNGGLGADPNRWKSYYAPYPENDPQFKQKLDIVNKNFK